MPQPHINTATTTFPCLNVCQCDCTYLSSRKGACHASELLWLRVVHFLSITFQIFNLFPKTYIWRGIKCQNYWFYPSLNPISATVKLLEPSLNLILAIAKLFEQSLNSNLVWRGIIVKIIDLSHSLTSRRQRLVLVLVWPLETNSSMYGQTIKCSPIQ